MYRRKSEVFKNADKMQDVQKEEVFGVYYEDNGEEMRISRKTTKQQKKNIRSSVNDNQIYRGFSKREITNIQRMSQGYFDPGDARQTQIRRSSGNYLNDSIIEHDEEESSSVEDPVFDDEDFDNKKSMAVKKKTFDSENR
jgi:hypothetical protein